jgi:hypothetical protein
VRVSTPGRVVRSAQCFHVVDLLRIDLVTRRSISGVMTTSTRAPRLPTVANVGAEPAGTVCLCLGSSGGVHRRPRPRVHRQGRRRPHRHGGGCGSAPDRPDRVQGFTRESLRLAWSDTRTSVNMLGTTRAHGRVESGCVAGIWLRVATARRSAPAGRLNSLPSRVRPVDWRRVGQPVPSSSSSVGLSRPSRFGAAVRRVSAALSARSA